MNIWIIVIAVMLISFTIQQVLESKFSKYSKVPNPSGLTGAQVAEKMLDWHLVVIEHGRQHTQFPCLAFLQKIHYRRAHRVLIVW